MSLDSRKLLGAYRTPKFRIGQKVDCLARGKVVVIGTSNGRIQWPIAVRQGTGGRSLVLYRDLARAVRRETNLAICHWWGVTPQTVSAWRKSLGVKQTEATTRWRTEFGKSPKMRKAIKAMVATARDPSRREKIAAAKRGKPRSKATIAQMRRANLGKTITAEQRAKIGSTLRAKGIRPPAAGAAWTEAENKILRELPPTEVVASTGRTLRAVYVQRSRTQVAKSAQQRSAADQSADGSFSERTKWKHPRRGVR